MGGILWFSTSLETVKNPECRVQLAYDGAQKWPNIGATCDGLYLEQAF